MDKIVILNANNESMQVEVVRYIGEANNRYFIFSLHELDTQGHMDIYVTKIVNQNGMLIGTNIIDDVEWQNLRNNLQRIIKENRANGNAIVNDLPYNELQNVKVADRRALRLLATSVDMLNLGYNPQANINNPVSEPVNNSFAQPNVQNNVQNGVQNESIPQNNLDIFNNTVQNTSNDVQNPNNDMNYYQQPIQQTNPSEMQWDMPQAYQQPMQQPMAQTAQQVGQQPMPQYQQPMQQVYQQPIQQPYQQPMQQSPQQAYQQPMQQTYQQPVQNPVDNSNSDNYKELYFAEKSKNDQLTAENNQLINELNNYKMMISDIQNVLSR